MLSTLFLTLAIGTLMVALSTGSPAVPTDADRLPPRPDLAMPKAEEQAAKGATLRLQLDFGDRWEELGGEWDGIWTVVQWKTAEGDWVTVPGWQGSLDTVVRTEDGGVIGQKSWWVVKNDLGSKNFRWLVYSSQEGKLLASSNSFDLPAHSGWTVLVEEVLD
jgi:hypothetical protein